uniref:Uncharacterized protein n=1 Tax=Octopus bimaculoides TaxID=37653 RepID=A0A0L8FN19_OCTBM
MNTVDNMFLNMYYVSERNKDRLLLELHKHYMFELIYCDIDLLLVLCDNLAKRTA